jgi:hypothetical protein
MLWDYWTSGTRVVDTWYWSNIGQDFTFTAWWEGQPNEPDTDFVCVDLVYTRWWDSQCEDVFNFICQQ